MNKANIQSKPADLSRHFQASTTPLEDIELVSYPGQSAANKQYREGYENYLNELPILNVEDPLLEEKLALTRGVMQAASKELAAAEWVQESNPGARRFKRTILAIESPYIGTEDKNLHEGVELIVAHWGDGFSSPVHGHNPGLLHEELLVGKMRVNTFRLTDPKNGVVRPVETILFEGNTTIASQYTKPGKYYFTRQGLIHNFTSIGFSASFHYVPEHTRDGRDNAFAVEHFDDFYKPTKEDVVRITSKDAMYSRIGDVIMVRSTNVPEYGDHYIVITGHPVMKAHGLRPQDRAIHAPTNTLLNQYEPETGLVLLKLNERAKNEFLKFHAIKVDGSQVLFPDASQTITTS